MTKIGSNASSICSDKIFFVQDNIEIVQDKNFVHGLKIHFLLSKLIQIEHFLLKTSFQSFPNKEIPFEWLLKVKNGHFNLGQNFCLRQF